MLPAPVRPRSTRRIETKALDGGGGKKDVARVSASLNAGEETAIAERERQRIAHDLHDGLGQLLAGIALKTQVLQETLAGAAPAAAAEVAAITRLVNEALAQTRLLARGLDPSLVRVESLSHMLAKLARDTEKLLRVACTFREEPGRTLESAELAQNIYRIAQEAINNAVRHGRATQVAMELSSLDAELTLVIRDNGRGLDAAGQPKSGIGLRIMNHRAQSLGGSCEVKAGEAGGAVVRCRVPLSRSPAG